MSLEYRSSRWYVIYRPDGRYGRKVRVPVPVTIKDREAAQKWHDDFIREWKAAKGQSNEPAPLTGQDIKTLWSEYLKWSELHHAATTHRDIINVGQWVKKYLGQYAAEGIGPHHVQIYQRLRTAEAGRPINRTVNKELAYLGGMIRWAGKQGHITMPQVLSAPEVVSIIKASEPFYRAYLLCLYALGLRSIEARNLKWKDVDWQRGTVKMVQKGGTEKSLPMCATLESALREIAPPEPILQASGRDMPVFQDPSTAKTGEPGEAVRDIRKAIKRACKRAGVTKRVTPHMLRHSCATHMVDEGVNLRVIQQFLGHANVSATEIYTHVSLENLRQAQASISRGLQNMGHRKSAKVVRLDTMRK
jgi:site-specific recombinase XerD